MTCSRHRKLSPTHSRTLRHRLSQGVGIAGLVCLLPLLACKTDSRARPANVGLPIYRGVGDASAAAALDASTFIIADDEHNSLRLYGVDRPPDPLSSVDLVTFLKPDPADSEADLEAAARLGDRIYWITSHNTNKRGQVRPNRDYFFATRARQVDGHWAVEPVGTPCRDLVAAIQNLSIIREAVAADWERSAAARDRRDPKKAAPKSDAAVINIEGMCASPDGKRLYIGFRQPRLADPRDGRPRALLVAIENPAEIADSGAAPRFGEPVLWDLDGLVIRALEYSPTHRAVFIVAGPEKRGPIFSLYRWSGDPTEPPVPHRTIAVEPAALTPESLIAFPGQNRLLVISDDGELVIPVNRDESDDGGGDAQMKNKKIPDPRHREFRTLWLDLDPASKPS